MSKRTSSPARTSARTSAHKGYQHTQSGVFHWFLLPFSPGCLAIYLAVHDTPGSFVLLFLAGIFGAIPLIFWNLTVRDEGDHLSARFGVVPLLRTKIPYAAITSVRRARSDVLDGWGVHWLPGRGWIFNLWGFDCVAVEWSGRRSRIGTDDPEGLARFLETRVSV